MAEQAPCTCGSNEKNRLIFPCSGQANTGQISNAVAIQLDEEGYGSFVCTALLASGSESLAERARGANEIVVIDGCGMECAKKIVEAAGIPVHQHLMITDLGIEKKSGDRSFTPEEVEVIASTAWKGEDMIRDSESSGKKPFDGSGDCGCSDNCR